MANYSRLQEAIDAGITNMTVLRNNSAQDDGTDTYSSDVDWFYFNSILVTNLYVSGNSWIGFGSNNEHLKVNRRDTKMYYFYKEVGVIGVTKFLKLRWCGYSAYNYTGDSYAQQFDVFIFDNGQIFLNFYKVPNANLSGTNSLTCGSSSVYYAPDSGTPCKFTFIPNDPAKGTGWSVIPGEPELIMNYKTNGSVEYQVTGINIPQVSLSSIEWDEVVPEGTSLRVLTKIDNESYSECTNGGLVQGIEEGRKLENSTLHIKVELSTGIVTNTPILKSMNIKIHNVDDSKVLVLVLGNGNVNSIQNAIGDVTVKYSGGNLVGVGGAVVEFEKTFTPKDLIFKGPQNEIEHIEVNNIEVYGNLIEMNYGDYRSGDEHIEVSSISVTGILTHIDDI